MKLCSVLLLAVVSTISCSSSSGSNPQDLFSDLSADAPAGLDADSHSTLPDMIDQDSSDTASNDIPVQWDALPTLPPGKQFSTRYAAGAAQRVVNPNHDKVFLAGFGVCESKEENCRFSEGIHDDLYVSAVALADTETQEVIVMVGVDAIGLMLWDIQKIHAAAPEAFEKAYGVKMEGQRIIIGASHSHSTPDTVGLYGPMDKPQREEEEYVEALRTAILDTALEAYGNLEDSTITWAKSSAPNEEKDDCADATDIYAIQGKRPSNGSVIFTWIRWVAHPTVYWDMNNAVSADYVGTLRKRVKDNTDDAVVVYFNGPIGSTYAVVPENCAENDAFPDGYKDADLTPDEHAAVACVGYNVADKALLALETGAPLAETGIVFRHKPFEFHPTGIVLMLVVDKEAVPGDAVDVTDPTSMFPSQFSWATLGDLELISVPGEGFPCFAGHIRDRLKADNRGEVIVLGLTQDWMGYLLAFDQWSDPDLNYHKTISPGENVEPAYIKALDELIDNNGE